MGFVFQNPRGMDAERELQGCIYAFLKGESHWRTVQLALIYLK